MWNNSIRNKAVDTIIYDFIVNFPLWGYQSERWGHENIVHDSFHMKYAGRYCPFKLRL